MDVIWLGQPAWMWLVFFAVVAALLTFDLGVLHRKTKEIGVRESLALSAGYVVLGLLFGAWVAVSIGEQAGIEYVTGFVVEKSLAMDNIFVIALIFSSFAIPRELHHRVLFWGVLGVIVLRAVMIGVGAGLVANFGWTLYLFAVFLILTGVRMAMTSGKEADFSQNRLLRWICGRFRVAPSLDGAKFFVRAAHPKTGKPALYATPMFLALAMIEMADVIFAVDSVPAIFAISTDPFVVYTSNIFAILGLRALYFALAAVMHRFAYLKQALAVLLVFIGSKIFIADLLGWTKFPPTASLTITFAILAAGIGWSLWRTRDRDASELHHAS